MPVKKAIERAEKDRREGKSPSTQAGEFVREEIHHIREGKHGARSTKQAIAIGLSEARRAGVELPPPKAGSSGEGTRRKAKRDLEKGAQGGSVSRRRAQATLGALEREGDAAVTPAALAKQGRAAARQRSPAERSAAARKAAQTRAARRSGG